MNGAYVDHAYIDKTCLKVFVRFPRVLSSVCVVTIVFFFRFYDTYAVGFIVMFFLFFGTGTRGRIGNHGNFIFFVITLALSLLLKFSYM
jgi:hypothetical protein